MKLNSPFNDPMNLENDIGSITIPRGKILCYIANKLRNSSSQELLRQKISRKIVEEYGYKKSDVDLDFIVRINKQRFSPEIVVFNEDKSHAKENIYIIIHVKDEKTSPNDSKNGVNLLIEQMGLITNCMFGLWTNGVDQITYQKEIKGHKNEEIIDLPRSGKNIEEYDQIDFNELRPATELKSVFKRWVLSSYRGMA